MNLDKSFFGYFSDYSNLKHYKIILETMIIYNSNFVCDN